MLTRQLSPRHGVTVYRDGEEALRQVRAGAYDVAILDLGLPRMSGDQVAQQLRLIDAGLVTVLMSGWHLAPGDERLRWFDLQLPKPLDIDGVEEVVARAMDLRDGRRGRG